MNAYHKKMKKAKNEKRLHELSNKAIRDYIRGYNSNDPEKKAYFRWMIQETNKDFNQRRKIIKRGNKVHSKYK